MLKKLSLVSTALVLATPSFAGAWPTPPVAPVPYPEIRVPLPAVLQVPMPAPAAP